MAKALIGHLEHGAAAGALLEVENARLRARVADLETLVRRLADENDALVARAVARRDDEALQPV